MTHQFLAKIRNVALEGSMVWQRHALERMLERNITRNDVREALLTGVVAEYYGDDYPFPSALIAGTAVESIIHVVAAHDEENGCCYIITVYRPDLNVFPDGITRRK